MDEQLVDSLVQTITDKIKQLNTFEVEASGRHIHLSRKDAEQLFGADYQMSPKKYLSQPGQFVCPERVTIIGTKNVIHNVVILGPERQQSQVEISASDALGLGIKAPIRESGHLEGTPGITIVNGNRSLTIPEGVIIAKRHVHVAQKDAKRLGVHNGELVKVEVGGADRHLIFGDVVIRVSDQFNTKMHIDYDEANACGLKKGIQGRIVK